MSRVDDISETGRIRLTPIGKSKAYRQMIRQWPGLQRERRLAGKADNACRFQGILTKLVVVRNRRKSQIHVAGRRLRLLPELHAGIHGGCESPAYFLGKTKVKDAIS
jgi:hypothetical protein